MAVIYKHLKPCGEVFYIGIGQEEKRLINADLNGSLNILRKVVGEFQYPIEVCSTPLVLTIK